MHATVGLTALHGEWLRHGEDARVAALRAHHRECDASIATRRLKQRHKASSQMETVREFEFVAIFMFRR